MRKTKQSKAGLCADILSVILEIQNLHTRFEENVENTRAFVIPSRNSENEPNEGCMGRPRKKVSSEEVHRLFTIYQSWKDVAKELGISIKTLHRRRLEFGMDVSSRNGPIEHCTKISNENLCMVVREALTILPDAGESYVIGASRSRGVNVQRQRIRDAIMVDPVVHLDEQSALSGESITCKHQIHYGKYLSKLTFVILVAILTT